MTSLYLGEAFGWQFENTAKVAISQLGEKNIITKRCRKAQLLQAQSHNPVHLGVKILGYIPVLNILAGSLAIYYGITNNSGSSERHHNNKFWILRGVSMILVGPLLIAVDLIKTIHDEIVAAKYIKANSELIAQQFNTPHRHNNPAWPGHPVWCGNS
jgi:hypothetical protein